MKDALLIICEILFFSLVLNIVLKKFEILPLIGYIITGIVAGTLFGMENSDILEQIAQFGIVFLMFMIGLDFSIEKVKSMKRDVFVGGGLQLLITAALFFLLAYAFKYDARASLIAGFAVAMSSTSIAIKILTDTSKIDRNHGRLAVSIALLQDIAVVPVLIMITVLSNSQKSVEEMLFVSLLNSVSVLVIIYFFGKYAVNYSLRHLSDTKSDELFMAGVLLIVLASAFIAHLFDIPYTLGAFIAGMIISESAYKHQIQVDLVPFKDVLLGIFFISVGLLVDLSFVAGHIPEILLLTTIVVGVKIAVIFYIAKMFYSGRTAIKAAIILSQIGEFAFVILTLSHSLQLIDKELSQILITTAVLSMISTPLLSKFMAPISYKFANQGIEEHVLRKASKLVDHIIVLGFGNTGKAVVKKLIANHMSYVAIEMDRDLVYDGQSRGYNVVFGNSAKKGILEALHINDAAAVVVTVSVEEDMLTICRIIRFAYPKVNLVARAHNERQHKLLVAAGVNLLIDESDEIGDRLVGLALVCNIEKQEYQI